MFLQRDSMPNKQTRHIHSSIIFTLILTISLVTSNFFIFPINACHNVGTYEADYQTPKTFFLRNDIVYGKEVYDTVVTLRFRITDPEGNVENTTPCAGKVATCAYQLEDDAIFGEWSIQVERFMNGGWHLLTGSGDIAYFYVIDGDQDSTPPVTTGRILDPRYFRHSDQTMWATSETLLRLTSDDGSGSGVKEIWYTYDGNWNQVSNNMVEFTIPSEGTYDIQWYAIDNVNNEEEMHSYTLHIDNTPPVTHIKEVHFNWFTLVTIFAVDNGGGVGISRIKVRFSPHSDWKIGYNPLVLFNPPDTFDYYAEDVLENYDEVLTYSSK